jgi:hypothetical protein
MGIRRLSDNSVKDVYRLGRTYGGRVPHDPDYPKLKNRGLGEIDPRQQQTQNPEDRAASTGDVKKAWLLGRALPPHFDPGGSGHRYRRRSEEG